MRNSRIVRLTMLAFWVLGCGFWIAWAAEPTTSATGTVRFSYVDVYVDSGGKALGAYQFELSADASRVKIAGVEGGENAAFSEPPTYDPAALKDHRIIIAAFSTAKDLPAGKTRVARIMVQISGEARPEYQVHLDTAAGSDGQALAATANIVEGAAQ